jgi:uncharacterized membrane protein YfcA
MEPSALVAFLVVVAIGSYIQTVTGFALGLIIMGAVTLFGLAPVEFSAIVVSLLAVVNSSLALLKQHRTVHLPSFWPVVAGLFPGVLVGIFLLEFFSLHAIQLLRFLLGAFIITSGVLLLYKPHPKTKLDSRSRFVAIGIIGGLFGGLFSTGGPPIVYHLYRQPLSVAVIRTTLLAIFIIATSLRILYVGIRGDINWPVLHLTLYCIPIVVVFTVFGRKFRPPLSDLAMRRLAFALLILLGVMLLLPKHLIAGS